MGAIRYGKWARVAAAASMVGVLLVSSSRPASAGSFTFTPGDLVIERVGSGTGTLVNSGNPIFLDEYTTAGVLVGTLPLPTTSVAGGNQQIIESGTAAYDGEMTLSGDGNFLVVPGYDTATGGGTSLTGTTAAAVPRVVATVDMNGNIDSTTAAANFATVQNFRSATATTGGGGATFFLSGNAITPAAGAAGGLARATDGATATTEITNFAGATGGGSGEVIDDGGTLYVVSRTSHTGFTIGTLSPLPTGAATVTPLPGFPAGAGTPLPSPDSIFLAKLNPAGAANPDTIYVTDDSLGQVQKWTVNESTGTWSETGDMTAPGGDTFLKGLTGSVNGATVSLYATANGTGATVADLYTGTDNTGFGGTASGTLATPAGFVALGANETFRGLVYLPVPSAPVPESPFAILLPLSALVVLGGGVFLVLLRRRRRAPSKQ